MAEALLGTKLFIPPIRSDRIVERPALYRALDDGAERKLTLVSAPAGFGKSTLVSGWLAGSSDSAAWVSLDADDNDPGVFWQYVLAALRTSEAGFGVEAKQIISSPQVRNPQPALVSMLNEITANSYAFTLVLDDYHAIESQEVHDSLSFFLEYLPPTMHVVLLTRVDPPFALGRLRANGDLTEIRAVDLQFSTDEVSDFLSRVMRLELTRDQIATLEKYTEGWVVGLKLAALSLQRQPDFTGFLNTFSGSHQYILEYLAEEVLNTLSDSRRAFLLRTSILDSFCPPLCEAVTHDANSMQVVDELLADNLFIIPLDRTGDWFRYHHLFAQLLQALLQRDFSDEIPDLHLRAAAWYRDAGFLSQAAEHVFRSGDPEQARVFVVKHWNDMLHLGGVATVLKWVNRLPEEMTRDDVHLALANCWARHLTGQTLAMAPYVAYAEAAFAALDDRGGLSEEEWGVIEAQVYMMRSALFRSQGRFEEGVADAEYAVRVVPPEVGFAAGPAWNLLGAARVGVGDINGGIEAYRKGIGIAYSGKNYLSAFAAVFWSTVYLIKQGRLTEAYEGCQQALQRAVRDGLSKFPAFGLLYVALALIALERDQLEETHNLVEQGGGFSEALRYGRYIRARLYLALGEFETAESVMQDVERIVMAAGEPYSIAEMHLEWAKMHICLGDTGEVRARFQALNHVDRQQVDHPLLRFSIDWLSAYIHWSDGQHERALEIADGAIRQARNTESTGELLRFLILQAIILDAAGKPTASHTALQEALEIGFSQGYLRTWLDAGEPIIPLLRKARQKTGGGHAGQAYLESVLSLCEKTFGRGAVQDDLLTGREREIMQLIYRGYSNPEIAEELTVSLNTVKKHTSNIYSKLDVTSRTQAIARARELNLV